MDSTHSLHTGVSMSSNIPTQSALPTLYKGYKGSFWFYTTNDWSWL